MLAMDTDVSEKQEAPQPAGGLLGASFGKKGFSTLMGLLVYFLVVTVVITYERYSLMRAVQDLEQTHLQEERQVSLNQTVARAILTVNDNYFAPNVDSAAQMLALEIEAVLAGMRKLVDRYPILADDIATMEQSDKQLVLQPSRATIAEIRTAFQRLVVDLDIITSDLRNRKQRLLTDYRHTYDRVTIEWMMFMVGGLGIFGGLGLIFFRRLVLDIDTVRERAIDIVRGFRGAPLTITRGDEMGALMEAINVMQKELRERETQLEIGRQQQFHKEKMAAVGSLAAAVAHEINNPLSAIVGIAESISAQQDERGCTKSGSLCQPRLILEQATRVMQITRQISEFSVPQSPEPELIDINGLIRSTCGFVSFDRRFRRIELAQTLDPNLPAVLAVADHMVQVMMNLLLNAADAIESTHPSEPTIEVSTQHMPDHIAIHVCDNGGGIAPEIQAKVFDEGFTTKPTGRGSGLGLALCRTLINQTGGTIRLESRPREGTTFSIILPIAEMGRPAD